MSARFALASVSRVIAAVVGVALVANLLVAASPGGAGERAARAAGVLPPDDSQLDGQTRAELIAEVEAAHDLDRPLLVRIAASIGNAARGDLGRSWRDERPVAEIVGRGLARTLALIIPALAVAVGIGMLIAGLAVRSRRRRWVVVVAGVAVDLALVTPPVWLALVLLGFAGSAISGLLFPVLALAVLPAAIVARHTRAFLTRLLGEPWVVAARARGLSERRVVDRYGTREVGAEIGPLVAPLVAYLLGASMVVETVFGIYGLGAALADASARGDAPIVVGISITAALVVSIASVAGQLLQRLCDPRLRELG